MEGVNHLKESFLLGVLNVGLPTFDVYSDLGLTAELYQGTATIYTVIIPNRTGTFLNGTLTETREVHDVSHPIYALSLLIPFMINYALGWRAWYYGDLKKSNNNKRKKFTWIFALLGCYPQLVSSRIIFLYLWKQPKKALKKKKHLERNVMENEVFTEAVPTTLIMTFLMVVFVVSREPDSMDAQLLAGDGYGRSLFLITFSTSALSAGLGLAKSHKVS